MQQTEKYWNLINRIVLTAIVVMATVGVVLAFTPKVKQLQAYQNKLDVKQQRIDVTVAEERKVRDDTRRFNSDPDFVEKVAHEVGYAHKDEVVFYFIDGNKTNAAEQ